MEENGQEQEEKISKEKKQKIKEELKERRTIATVFVKTFLKWMVMATVLGLVCGIVGIGFHELTNQAAQAFTDIHWLLYLLPVAGLIIVFLYRICGIEKDKGTNMVIASIRCQDELPLKMVPLIFCGTVLTHLCGGSSGREGAALQLGGSMGAFTGRIFKLDERDIHTLTMCGMSGVFSAVFGTPITAAIFSIEVVSVGIWHYSAFVPCIMSAVIAYSLTGYFGVEAGNFHQIQPPDMSWIMGAKVVILATLCALVSILFVQAIHWSGKLYAKLIENQYLRILAGAVLIIGITLLLGTTRYNGTGIHTVEAAIAGEQMLPQDFVLKIVLTALTIGAGFKGGEIVPSFFVGATFGSVVGTLLGMNPGLGAAIGMLCLFCGAVNCPIAAILLGVELLGVAPMLYFGLACSVSYMLSGYYGLYSSQKIVYSKVHPRFLDRYTIR